MCTGFFPSSFDAIEHSLTERKDYVSMINIGRMKRKFQFNDETRFLYSNFKGDSYAI